MLAALLCYRHSHAGVFWPHRKMRRADWIDKLSDSLSATRGAHLPRVGLRRARFMHESVSALQLALQERSQELIIFQGSADAALRRLAAPAGKLRILAVHAHADVCIEEVDAEARVRASLASLPGSSAQLELH